MAFRGVYPASELKPSVFGILSVARVMSHTARAYDERWIRGFAFEYDSEPTVRLLEETGSSVHTIFDSSGLAQYIDVKPFFIEVEDSRSTFGLTGEDRMALVVKQLEAATQKAVERELWNGYVVRDDGTTSQYLTEAGEYTLAAGSTAATAVSAWRAIAILEGAMSNSPAGEQGVIHVPRDVAIQAVSDGPLIRVESADGREHLETINGTPVIVGSGYTGDGPFSTVTNKALTSNVATITTATDHGLSAGDTVTVSGVDATFNGTFTVASVPSTTTFTYAKTASNVSSTSASGLAQMSGSTTTKWIFATGCVDVHLGKPEVVNESLAQGFDVSGNQNDMLIKALRPAAVYFDPAIHYAVKVDLTA
jgi:hypothetical protein